VIGFARAQPNISPAISLWSVDMVSSTDGWAVEDSGKILKWDGTSWQYFTSPLPVNQEYHLFSVNMVSSTDGWAVGSDGIIIHWDGTEWNNVTSPTGKWLESVNMVSSDDGWIVGADRSIFRWQEEIPDFFIIYAIIIGVAALVLAVLLYLRYTRKKNALARATS
jgi:photosystem II stability/assembly factor-like uncharacterized protein